MAQRLARDQGPQDPLQDRRRHGARRRRRRPAPSTRRDARRRRRVRLRQDRDRAVGAEAASRCRPAASSPAQILLEGRDLRARCRRRAMREIRAKEIAMIFQEPMTSLNPVLHRRRADRRDRCACTRASAGATALERAVEMLKLVQHPDARAARRRLSAPVLRRHAPARDDRHGAVLQPEAADRRRADHGARRHHPGADPRAAAAT